ncbi:MAG: desulfoferrodoxin FeS4 iron-binding domain-containing protein [Spirochaetales bacterium]|nr:MAG: desulfoferrodoxin FeS4 iron-binding domain-containing protein [Spirochaetales bacterium]
MADFFKCSDCARIVKVIQEGRGNLTCCGKSMQPLANFQSVNSILDFAIEKEVEARDFYLEWAGKLEAAHLKELFLMYSGEEQKHKDKLERIKSGSTFQPAAAKVTDLKIVDYLVDIVPTPDMDYQEALILAMRREKSSFKLYSDLAAMSGVDDMRTLFQSLAQEEAKHKLRIETEYEKDVYREN